MCQQKKGVFSSTTTVKEREKTSSCSQRHGSLDSMIRKSWAQSRIIALKASTETTDCCGRNQTLTGGEADSISQQRERERERKEKRKERKEEAGEESFVEDSEGECEAKVEHLVRSSTPLERDLSCCQELTTKAEEWKGTVDALEERNVAVKSSRERSRTKYTCSQYSGLSGAVHRDPDCASTHTHSTEPRAGLATDTSEAAGSGAVVVRGEVEREGGERGGQTGSQRETPSSHHCHSQEEDELKVKQDLAQPRVEETQGYGEESLTASTSSMLATPPAPPTTEATTSVDDMSTTFELATRCV